MQQDQSGPTLAPTTEIEDQSPPDTQPTGQPSRSALHASPATTQRGFDWFALAIVLLIAAFFAIVARINAQPANSFTPIAALSATGCGLLVTALRKLRTVQRPGLLAAAVSGFCLALFQFIVAITYPGVFSVLLSDQGNRLGFLSTWGLIAACSLLFSIIGATLGHLAFAPPRPLPTTARAKASFLEEEQGGDVHASGRSEAPLASDEDHATSQHSEGQAAPTQTPVPTAPSSHTRMLVNYLIIALFFGFAPVVVGFVFSAAYDYMLGIYQFTLGPFPTLRLLSAMLPWQVPFPLNIGNASASVLTLLLWRLPFFFGNPTLFDLQALEPFAFNALAFGLLLLTTHGKEHGANTPVQRLGWYTYLLLEFALGLFLVLPSNLWMLQGLAGIVQISNVAFPIRTLQLLNPLTFTLNLFTGPVICMGIGSLLRLWKRQ